MNDEELQNRFEGIERRVTIYFIVLCALLGLILGAITSK